MLSTSRIVSFGITILFLLSACGGSSSGGGGDGRSGAVTTALATGTWRSNCILDDEDPGNIFHFIVEIIIDATTVSGSVDGYDEADTQCAGAIIGTEVLPPSTYTLGSNVTVDGSVAGITTATEIDITDPGPPEEVDYDLVAIWNNRLYLGDTDGANDGTSPAKRATQLEDDEFFTKQ